MKKIMGFKFGIVGAAVFMSAAIGFSNFSLAKVKVKKSTSYYTVSGSSGIQIAKGLSQKGPRRTKLSHAIASTQWGYSFGKPKVSIRGRKCVIDDIDVTLTLKYTIPKWKPSKGASSELKTTWSVFRKLIIAHEDKHGEIAEQGARSIEKAIKSMTANVSKDCKDFGRFAKSKFSRIARSIALKQRAFDRREKFALSKIARAQKKLIKTK